MNSRLKMSDQKTQGLATPHMVDKYRVDSSSYPELCVKGESTFALWEQGLSHFGGAQTKVCLFHLWFLSSTRTLQCYS